LKRKKAKILSAKKSASNANKPIDTFARKEKERERERERRAI